jgi:ankyrin repeat protein
MAVSEGTPAVTYRFGTPTRFGALGALLLLGLSGGAWALSRRTPAATMLAWIVVAVAALLFVHGLIQRLARRTSEHITLDGSGISRVHNGRYRTLRWESITSVRIRRGDLELADSNRFVVVTLPRQLENFSDAMKRVLAHLESAYDRRPSGARSRAPAATLSFTLPIRPQVSYSLGLLIVMAAGAWTDIRVLWTALTAAPIALWNVSRTAYLVMAGPIVKVRTLVSSHELPIDGVRGVRLEPDVHNTPWVMIEDVYGERLSVALPSEVGRQLELYDRIRRLIELHATGPGSTGMTSRIALGRATLFAASCVVTATIILAVAVRSGELLRFSAQRGWLPIARTAVALGSPVDAVGLERRTALYLAAKSARVSSVEFLLASGADPARPCGEVGFTPLHIAAEWGRIDVVRVLLKAGVNPDVRDDWKQTPLWRVSRQNGAHFVDIAKVLLDAGATIDAGDKDGWTPVHRAVRNDDQAMLAYLIRRGGNVSALTRNGNTPMSTAIEEHRTDAVRTMIDARANLNARDGSGKTPLARAASVEKFQPFVGMLLKAGARTDIRDNNEYTPLQDAVWFGQRAAVEQLLRHGADPNAAVEAVDLPLLLAIQQGHTEIARSLLASGAKWDAEAGGWTAIQRAAWRGHADIVSALIDRGASPLTSSSTVAPTLQVAAGNGQLAVVSMLVKRGVDLNQRWGQWTAVRIARARRHAAIVDYLLAHGGR